MRNVKSFIFNLLPRAKTSIDFEAFCHVIIPISKFKKLLFLAMTFEKFTKISGKHTPKFTFTIAFSFMILKNKHCFEMRIKSCYFLQNKNQGFHWFSWNKEITLFFLYFIIINENHLWFFEKVWRLRIHFEFHRKREVIKVSLCVKVSFN